MEVPLCANDHNDDPSFHASAPDGSHKVHGHSSSSGHSSWTPDSSTPSPQANWSPGESRNWHRTDSSESPWSQSCYKHTLLVEANPPSHPAHNCSIDGGIAPVTG